MKLVVPEGLEPPTPTLGKWRSVQLSYGTTPMLLKPAARGDPARQFT